MLTQEWDWDVAKSVWQKEAKEEGLKKGRAEGREEGRREGRREGREEGIRQSATETARRLLQEGLSVDLVAGATQLPIDEVQRLRNTASHVNENPPEYHRA